MRKSPDWPLIGMLILTAGLLAMPVDSIITHYRMRALIDNGARVYARIEAVSIELKSLGRHSELLMFVTYRFLDTQGNSHLNKRWYPKNAGKDLKQGDQLPVIYRPSNPEDNFPSLSAMQLAEWGDDLLVVWLFTGIDMFVWVLFFKRRWE